MNFNSLSEMRKVTAMKCGCVKNIRCVTMPAEKGADDIVLELAEKLGVDAIRDCDGTKLSDSLLEMGFDTYSTICLVRADQEWAQSHPEQLPQQFLMSFPKMATNGSLEIELIEGFSHCKYKINGQDPHKFWEVIDRTTGEIVSVENWNYDEQTGIVALERTRPFHMYTVNFLAYQIWDSVSMYNHITNNWKGKPIMSVDPIYPDAYEHLMNYFDNWLATHPSTDVVRLTTLAYNFTLINDNECKQIFSDWRGYVQAVSPFAIDEFERSKGYRLRSEDFVDEGYYNAIYRKPSKGYLDWMDFIQSFVVKFGKDLVDKIHKSGKKAAIFWGDHWVGVEPFNETYQEMGIDINVGACESGVSLRRVADAPGSQVKEVRLFPYFFPDTFFDGGNPAKESMARWIKIRRALVRQSIDRIGWGGYLSLAFKFPKFVEHIENVSKEFREFISVTGKSKPSNSNIKVAILTSWGKLRSWINHGNPAKRFNVDAQNNFFQSINSDILECLAGLPVEVEFISFDDIRNNGLSKDVNIILNDGHANSAWSGDDNWKDARIVTALREWVWNGGAFLGVQDPSACQYQGNFYQLFDLMGVDKEVGNQIGFSFTKAKPSKQHFILNDAFCDGIDFGIKDSYVYIKNKEINVLASHNYSHILMSSNNFGDGRSVYLAGLPFNLSNCRLLQRILFWLAKKESELPFWFTSNLNTEFAFYPEKNVAVIFNNIGERVETSILIPKCEKCSIELEPFEMKWFSIAKEAKSITTRYKSLNVSVS